MTEQFKITLILGNRGTGKTGTVIRRILPGYIVRKAIRKKKVRIAILDLVDNYNYNSFECMQDVAYPEAKKILLKQYVKMPVPVITRPQLQGLKAGVVRVLPAGELAGDFASKAFKDICYSEKIQDCLIVIEDSARFMPDNNGFDADLRNMIINSKQRAMDLVLMFHYWSDVPPKLLKWVDQIYLHKCDESVKIREKALPESKYQKIRSAEEKAKTTSNKYHAELISLNT